MNGASRRLRVPWQILLILSNCLIWSSGCREQADYPSQPITLVCPWAVGGGTDRISRLVAIYLEEDLGVPVNVVKPWLFRKGGSGGRLTVDD